MATKKGAKPAPLDPKVTKKLLDKLATDNDFRRLFKKDAHAALAAGRIQGGGGRKLRGRVHAARAQATGSRPRPRSRATGPNWKAL